MNIEASVGPVSASAQAPAPTPGKKDTAPSPPFETWVWTPPKWWKAVETRSEAWRPMLPLVLIALYVAIVWLMAVSNELFGTPGSQSYAGYEYQRCTWLYFWVSAASATMVGELTILFFSLYRVSEAISKRLFTAREAVAGFSIGVAVVVVGFVGLAHGEAGGKAAATVIYLLDRHFLRLTDWVQVLNLLTVPAVVMAAALALVLTRALSQENADVPKIARQVQLFFLLSCWYLAAGVFEIYFLNALGDSFREQDLRVCGLERWVRLIRDVEPALCHPIREWGKSLSGQASVGFTLILLLIFVPLVSHVNHELVRTWHRRPHDEPKELDMWLQYHGLYTRPVALLATAFGILAPAFTGLLAKLF